jgi:chaperonin cofactor prefoldin
LVLVDAKQTLKKSLEEYDYHVTSIENQYAALKDENSALKRNLESKTKLLMDTTGSSSGSQIR